MTTTDILIIGGGIAGVSTAYHLALLGHRVTLVERGEIASEASGVNAGAIGAIGWRRVPDLELNKVSSSCSMVRLVSAMVRCPQWLAHSVLRR
jgi:sarcosine oxidase subunit beta